jgi:hypothetical protein
MHRLMAFAAVVAASGCAVIEPKACTADARAAVSVDVRDSVSNTPAGRGAVIFVRDGVYADTARFTEYDGPYGVAYEREGTYTLTVEQVGYKPWTRSGLAVGRDDCHVKGVSLVARLQK